MQTYFRKIFIVLIYGFIIISCTSGYIDDTEKIVLKVQRAGFGFPRSYIIGTDGVGEISSTLPKGLGENLEWSPNNKWVAYENHYVNGFENSVIYIMSSNGIRRIRVPTLDNANYRPTWSPDGSQIAYYTHTGIYKLNVACMLRSEQENCAVVPVFLSKGQFPDWSPDGKLIVYVEIDYSGSGNDRVLVINAEGQDVPTDITPPQSSYCHHPKWSPDGKRIVVGCGGEIYVMNADGSNVEQFIDGGGYPSWSPDGTKIAFVSSRDGLGKCIGGLCGSGGVYSNAIFLMDLNDGTIIRLSLRDDEDVLWYAWIPQNISE